MESPTDSTPLVRCSACHAVYEQPRGLSGEDDRAGCPACDETVWIALEIPMPETGDGVTA
jgi:hypothetical protein